MLILVFGKWPFACNDSSRYVNHTPKRKGSRTKNAIVDYLRIIKIAGTFMSCICWYRYQHDIDSTFRFLSESYQQSLCKNDGMCYQVWSLRWAFTLSNAFRKHGRHLHFVPFLNTETSQLIEIHSQRIQEHSLFCSQYQGCWWPGDARSQVIGRYDIDLVCMD